MENGPTSHLEAGDKKTANGEVHGTFFFSSAATISLLTDGVNNQPAFTGHRGLSVCSQAERASAGCRSHPKSLSHFRLQLLHSSLSGQPS